MNISREAVINTLALLALAAAGVWFVRHTEWVDQQVPVAPHSEAARDRHYAVKKILARLDAKVVSPPNLDRLPPPSATLVLGSWNWDLFPEREQALRRWVEAGGHLVMPAWKQPKWVPIERKKIAKGAASAPASANAPRARPRTGPLFGAKPYKPACHDVAEPPTVDPAFAAHRSYRLCDGPAHETLHSAATVQWSVDGPNGAELMRVALGRGSVVDTMDGLIDNDSVFDGDHALAFVAALHLQPGDEVWFVDTEERTPLLALVWRSGAPAVLLFALLIALLLWRAGVRFGPRAPTAPLARRSVAEQIRGTAQFIFQRDSAALHRAQLRALETAARRRLRDHDRLDRRARAEAIAKATALDATDLARAMDPALKRSRHELASTLALLETALRRLTLNT